MLAIIPARGGSKGIPRKNLVPLCGKPLVQHTIEAALSSRLITRVILSTEDEEIARVGERMGLDMSYTRPVELATDETSMDETITHCLNWVSSVHGQPESFLVLQPTSPLRNSSDIDMAITRFNERLCDYLVSVNKMSEHPYECIEVLPTGECKFLRANSKSAVRRQDYDGEFYYINGAIYIYKYRAFRTSGFAIDPSAAQLFLLPESRCVDIDTFEQLLFAQSLFNDNYPELPHGNFSI